MCAPLATACSYSSNTSTAAPSPIINPPRRLSNGKEAAFLSFAADNVIYLGIIANTPCLESSLDYLRYVLEYGA